MLTTCDNVSRMSKMIQIRNVPDEIHRILKIRAVKAGLTLSEYLLREVAQVAVRPDIDELFRNLQNRKPPALSETPAEAVRFERESRS